MEKFEFIFYSSCSSPSNYFSYFVILTQDVSHTDFECDQSNSTFDEAKAMDGDQGTSFRPLSRTKSNVTVLRAERYKWVVMSHADVAALKRNILSSLQQCEEALNKIIVEVNHHSTVLFALYVSAFNAYDLSFSLLV